MATTFTLVKGWTEGDLTGKRRKVLVGTLVTDGNDGAAAGDIPASLFNMSKVEEVLPLVKSDDTLIVVTGPAYAGTSILGKAAATAAAADIPAGTYNITIKGY